MKSLTAFGLPNFPMIHPGDDLVQHIVTCAQQAEQEIYPDDIVIIAQKVISKTEGRLVRIGDVTPSARAIELAEITDKDPRAVEIILSDTNEVLRALPGLLVVEQKSGWICANAGVDRSNIEPLTPTDGAASDGMAAADIDDTATNAATDDKPKYTDDDVLSLLPEDADASANRIRQGLASALGIAEADAPAVIITDTHGRPWRIGQIGICIGCAGIPPVWDQRGGQDLFGYELKGSEEAIADELAAMAGLLMGAGNEGVPVVIVRGYQLPSGVPSTPAVTMQRPKDRDAFR